MINQDDEEDTSNSVGVSRYPCMPSLVAMQQMRNRLNLAYLGKKLMKWSAMATGRELRRISHEMHGVYDDYSDDSRNGYITLARARYFYPHLNSIVIENVPKKAQITLASSIKSISGVRVTEYYIEDTGVDAYEHLGIERGGQLIKETKKAWNDLVKRMIMILELRTSFILVEQANRSATKKMNVLGKIVIPKTIMSLEYIAAELEEHEREEFFRLKKVLQIKVKKTRALFEYLNPEGEKKEVPEPVPLTIEIPKPVPVTLPPVIEEKRCVVCNELISEAGKVSLAAELVGDSDLEAYKYQLSQLAAKTKEVEAKVPIEGLSTFRKTVEEMKQAVDIVSKTTSIKHVVPRDVNVEDLCPKCKALYDEQNNPKKIEKTLEPEPVVVPLRAPEPEPEPQPAPEPQLEPTQVFEPTPEPVREPTIESIIEQTPEIAPVVSDTSGLGTYEEETKVITRVLRKKNPDGSITEEKRVLKVRKTVKDPSIQPTDADDTGDRNNDSSRERSGTSSKSNPYSGSKTVGIILLNELNKKRSRQLIRSQSEVLSSTSPMGYPVVRYCISLGNVNSASYEETTSRVEVSQCANRFINSVISFDFNRKLTSAVSESVLNTSSKKENMRRSNSCSYEGEIFNSKFD